MITRSIFFEERKRNILVGNLVQLCGASSSGEQQTPEDSSILTTAQELYQKFASKNVVLEFLKTML